MRKILQLFYKIYLFKRIVPSLLKIFLRFFDFNKIIIKHENVLIQLNLKNPIDREIFLKDKYEKKQIDFLSDQIEKKKIDYFLDIGAHMGFYSVNLSKKKINIFSFEPIKENFNQLKKNKIINNLENIKLYNVALSDKKRDITMWVSDKNKTGGFSVFDKNDQELAKYKKDKIFHTVCKSDQGDHLLDLKNKNIAIKIDVERHEKNVLDGMPKLLKNNKVILQIELFDQRKDEVIEKLKQKNFFKYHKIQKDYYFKNF